MGSFKSFLRGAGLSRFLRRKPSAKNAFILCFLYMFYLIALMVYLMMLAMGWMVYGMCWVIYKLIKLAIDAIKNRTQQ